MAYTPFKMKGPSLYKAPGKVNEGQPKKEKTEQKPTVLPTVNVSAEANKIKITQNEDGGFTKSKGSKSQTYKKNPNYDPNSSRTTNYKYVTGEKDSTGAPIGTNNMG